MANEMREVTCTYCEDESIGCCENCDARLCFEHESSQYEDVYVCKDEAACSARITAKLPSTPIQPVPTALPVSGQATERKGLDAPLGDARLEEIAVADWCEIEEANQMAIELIAYRRTTAATGVDWPHLYQRTADSALEYLRLIRGFRQKLATYQHIYTGDKELRELLTRCDVILGSTALPGLGQAAEWVRWAGALIDVVNMTAEDYQNEEVVEFLQRHFLLLPDSNPTQEEQQ